MTHNPPSTIPDPEPFTSRHLFQRPFFWIVLVICAILVGATAALVEVYRSDLILPGVEALGVDLGRLYRDQAAAALYQAWDQQRLEVIAADVVDVQTPSALGLVLDAPATAESAHALSRTRDHVRSLLGLAPSSIIEPVWSVQLPIAHAYVQSMAARVDRPPVNATTRRVEGHLEAIPSQPGRALDLVDAVDFLREQAPQVLTSGQWELPVDPVPPHVIDLGTVVAEANVFLDHDLMIHLSDPIREEALTWTIRPSVWNRWLELELDESYSAVQWELDVSKAKAGLEERMVELGPDRELDVESTLPALRQALVDESWEISLRVHHSDQRYTVIEGDTLSSIAFEQGMPYPWIQRANPGLGDELYAGQVITIPSPEVLLPLPIIPGKRITVSLESQTMRAYENGQVKWEWPVSTGLPPSPTATGLFQIQSHELNAYAARWDLWMPHFMGIYQPVPDQEFMNGFHGFPSRGGNQLLWVNHLGRPVTYGCIMVSSENAELLYDWAEEGVLVQVDP